MTKKERDKKYYQKNRKKILAKCKEYRQAHKEEAAKYHKKYQQENREHLKEYNKRYRQENKKSLNAREAKWYVNNSERGKANAKVGRHRRRARIAKVGGKFIKADIINMYLTQWMRCYYCSVNIEEKYHIDHMTPISRSGSNWIDNICLTCVECNLSKHTKTAEEFIEQKGFMYGI